MASRSPRRRELLHQIGVHFDLLMFRGGSRNDEDVDESALANESPEHYVERIALLKTKAGQDRIATRHLIPRLVLAADTTLDVDGQIIGKPANPAAAEDMLSRLSGRSHRVLTAVAISDGKRIEHHVSISDVRFRVLLPAEIRDYVASGEPLDKAGGYGIQGRAGMFIEEIRGSYSGIMGLPLCETAQLLRSFGYPV